MTDPRISELAETHLTTKQLDVWYLVTGGCSQRETSYRLDIARTTVTDRYDAACRTLRRHGVRFTPDGRPYLEEHTPA